MYSCHWALNGKFFITRSGSLGSVNAPSICCSRCRMWIRLALHKVRAVGLWQQERRRRATVQCSVSSRRDSGHAGTGFGGVSYERGIAMLSRSVMCGTGDKYSTPFKLCVTCCIFQVSFRNSGHWLLQEEVESDYWRYYILLFVCVLWSKINPWQCCSILLLRWLRLSLKQSLIQISV